jgi:hypothetical protein
MDNLHYPMKTDGMSRPVSTSPDAPARVIGGCAGPSARPVAAAARTKHTYLSARYRRLASRRGKKRAKVALEHDILIAAWYIMRDGVDYADLGGDYFDTHVMDPRLKAARLAQQLPALGYRVTLEHVA